MKQQLVPFLAHTPISQFDLLPRSKSGGTLTLQLCLSFEKYMTAEVCKV